MCAVWGMPFCFENRVLAIEKYCNSPTVVDYSSGFQQVVQGPPVVPEGVPGGPQLNDGELVTKEPL